MSLRDLPCPPCVGAWSSVCLSATSTSGISACGQVTGCAGRVSSQVELGHSGAAAACAGPTPRATRSYSCARANASGCCLSSPPGPGTGRCAFPPAHSAWSARHQTCHRRRRVPGPGGPSGCGKSTALRTVAGLEDISSGTMKIGDRVVNTLSPKNRDIGMVFQSCSSSAACSTAGPSSSRAASASGSGPATRSRSWWILSACTSSTPRPATPSATRSGDATALRSAQWYGGSDRNAYVHRAWMRRGLPRHAFDGRPHIAIANTASDLTPCNSHLDEVAASVKEGVGEAGGVPLNLPVVSLGETQVRPTAMLWRNLAAMATEEMLRANPVDGAVLLGGCDKTIPALLMAAASVDLPALVVPGGPMLTGWF